MTRIISTVFFLALLGASPVVLADTTASPKHVVGNKVQCADGAWYEDDGEYANLFFKEGTTVTVPYVDCQLPPVQVVVKKIKAARVLHPFKMPSRQEIAIEVVGAVSVSCVVCVEEKK